MNNCESWPDALLGQFVDTILLQKYCQQPLQNYQFSSI